MVCSKDELKNLNSIIYLKKACKSEVMIPSKTLEYLEQTKQFVEELLWCYCVPFM